MAYREEGTITLKMLATDLASGKVGTFIGNLDKLAQKGGLVGSIAQGVGQSFGQMLNPMGLATSAIGMFTDYAGSAITAASALTESQSKAVVVFGDSMDAIDEWASHSATAMGASKQAALEMAGTLGNLFTALGLTQDASAGMSMEAVQLAADLASFNNLAGGTEEALDKIRSGLVGESEPLRSMGVNLTEAGVAAEAVALGLAKTTSQVSSQAKVQARWSLIVKQSKNAAGDFARTSDGLANSQRILDAQMADVSATVGTALLPVMQKLTNMAKDYLVPALLLIPEAFGLIEDAASTMTPFIEKATHDGNMLALQSLERTQQWLKMQSVLADELGLSNEQMLAEMHARIGDSFMTNEQALAQIWTELKEGRFVPLAKEVGKAGAQALGSGLTTGIAEVKGKVTVVAGTIPGNIADGLRSGVSDVRSASKALRAAILNPMKPINDLAYIRGQLTGKDLKKGLASQDPYVAAQARVTRRTYLDNLNGIVDGGYIAGYDAGAALIDGLRASGVLDQVAGLFGLGGAREYQTPKGSRPKGFSKWSAKKRRNWLEKHPGRASGGPVSAGESYLVGEDGPEILQMGGSSGNVVPNHKLGGVTVVYSPQYSTASPIEAQRFVTAILPELQRAMARSG